MKASIPRLTAALVGVIVIAPTPSAAADTGPRSPDQTRDVSVRQTTIPDLLDGSRPMLPTRDVAKIKRQHAAVPATSVGPLGEYHSDGYAPMVVAGARLPYLDEFAPRTDYLSNDGSGVRMFPFAGRLWDHPVAQAQWGLMNLSSYRTTGDTFFLDRAIANAQRNLDRHVESRGAWWYPYDFDIARCADAPPMRAPWYSAMAQGQLLSLFVRIHELTADEKWRQAADRTFDSLTLPPDPAAPWGTWVDPDGYRWLEEYPQIGLDATPGERVMNGHIFATFGVYDYWRLTGDPRTVEVLDSAATTVRHYLPNQTRLPNWASKYSIGCPHPHTRYHQVHIGQSMKLYEMTHASTFTAAASLLRNDYPAPGVLGTVRFKAGTHLGYRFDAAGNTVITKTMTLGRASNAHTEKRVRIKDRGIFYLITDGVLRGYLVPERFPDSVLLGKTVEQRYYPLRKLTFQARTYTAYAYDSKGNVIRSNVGTFSKTYAVSLAATAVVNGRLSYLPAEGHFKGWWLPHTSGTRLS